MNVSQVTSAVADHWHSLAVSTVIDPVPPADPIVDSDACTATAQRLLAGATTDVEDDAPHAARSGSSRHDAMGPQVRIGFVTRKK